MMLNMSLAAWRVCERVKVACVAGIWRRRVGCPALLHDLFPTTTQTTWPHARQRLSTPSSPRSTPSCALSKTLNAPGPRPSSRHSLSGRRRVASATCSALLECDLTLSAIRVRSRLNLAPGSADYEAYRWSSNATYLCSKMAKIGARVHAF